MRVIVAGSRSIGDYAEVARAIEGSGFAVSEIVSGGCRGPDLLGEKWAEANGVTVRRFPADWSRYGQAAGPIRNAVMARYAAACLCPTCDGDGHFDGPDAHVSTDCRECKGTGTSPGGLVALWDGRSRGTASMIAEAHRYRLRVHVHRLPPPEKCPECRGDWAKRKAEMERLLTSDTDDKSLDWW